MVDALPNLQMVYDRWQSRNPYLRPNQPRANPNSAADGGGDSYSIGQKSWQSHSERSLRPPVRHRASKQRGGHRQQNGLTDAEDLMVCSSCSCSLFTFYMFIYILYV